jgi:hypothetical protein
METLLMSAKERKRLLVLAEVKKRRMSLAQAGRLMSVSYRQAKRIWSRFFKKGDAGLVHGSRGKPGPRAKALAVRGRILARFDERYADFGPTLAAEYLRKDGWAVDHETLRRWLIKAGRWQPGRPRRKHRAWRERRECFGQMVQLDGSEHDWFEGRRGRAVLMVIVDDATGCTDGEFFESETTHASYDTVEGWIGMYGVPSSVYVDKDSIYRCERAASVAEQIAGQEPRTQFGRAMDELGVELILAHSPQAKGRVERRNGILQDRLVKALRLEGIGDLASANEFLRKKFWPEFNRKFQRKARSPANAHTRAPRNLDEILSWQEERVVSNDWCVQWKGQCYQIGREAESLGLPGRKVLLRRRRNGQVEAFFKGRKLNIKILPEGAPARLIMPSKLGATHLTKPAIEHPWRKTRPALGKQFWKAVRKEGAAQKRAHVQAAAAFAQPPLRSSFATAAAA